MLLVFQIVFMNQVFENHHQYESSKSSQPLSING